MGCHIPTWDVGKQCVSEFGESGFVLYLKYEGGMKCFQACDPEFTFLDKISETVTRSSSKDRHTHTWELGTQIRGLNSEVQSKDIRARVIGLENK